MSNWTDKKKCNTLTELQLLCGTGSSVGGGAVVVVVVAAVVVVVVVVVGRPVVVWTSVVVGEDVLTTIPVVDGDGDNVVLATSDRSPCIDTISMK